MALSTATISYDIADLIGTDFDIRRTKVWVSTNIADGTVVDTVGNAIRVDTGQGTLAADGTGSVTVWTPGTGSNPDSWQTYVHLDYASPMERTRKRRTFGPFTVTTAANLADLVEEQEVPAEYLTTITAALQVYVDDAETAEANAETAEANAEAAQAAAEAARDDAIDLSGIATPDGVVEALIQDDGSDTAIALAVSSDARAGRIFTPKQYGATGGGVADDSDEVQACFTAAGNFAGKSTVVIDDTYRVTENLYGFGLTDFDGPGSIVLDADLSASDGNAYWINMGIKAKSGTTSIWTGTWSADLTATTNASTIGRMFNIHHGIYCWITGGTFDMLACAASSTIGAIGVYNNAGWTTNPERSHIHIVGNTILAAQAAEPGGSEGIGIGPVDHLWIEDNYIHGVGDDPIGIHTADHFTVSGNRCFSRDGRLYISGGTNGHIHDNHFERIANPNASWTSGGGLMHFDIETSTQPANADLHIHDNTLVHGSGIASATYGIRLRGVRRFNVHDNRIHDTTGFGYAVTWEGITVTSWTDSEGLEGDNKARTRDGRITHNFVTGVGADGQMKELVQFAGDCVGPIVFEGNTPGAGGIDLVNPAAYTSGRTGQGRMPVKHKSGIYHANHAWSVTTGTPSAGTIQAQPLLLDAVKTMTKLAVEITTGGSAGAVWRFGIYADNDGYPGALVLDAGTAASTATGLCEVTLTQVLAPGLYWLAAVPQVATSAAVCHTPIPLAPIGFGTALTMTAVPGLHAYQTTGVTGALPNPWTATVSASGANCPRVLWKFA